MIKEFMLLPDRSLRDAITQSKCKLSHLSDCEVVDRYNRTVRSGFVVRQQAIETLVLHYLMKERFGSSPLKIHHNCILELTSEVQLLNGAIVGKNPNDERM